MQTRHVPSAASEAASREAAGFEYYRNENMNFKRFTVEMCED